MIVLSCMLVALRRGVTRLAQCGWILDGIKNNARETWKASGIVKLNCQVSCFEANRLQAAVLDDRPMQPGEQDMAVQDMVTTDKMIAFVEDRGFKVKPILNTIAAGEGKPLEVTGFNLFGPRGNKTCLGKDKAGLVSLSMASLWCDCVDYATAKIKERKKARVHG